MCELCLLVPFFGLDRVLFLQWFLPRFFFVDRFPSEPLLATAIYSIEYQTRKFSTGSWTRVFGFEVQGAEHYTIEPIQIRRMLTSGELPLLVVFYSLFVMVTVCLLFGFFLVFVHWLVSLLTRCVKCNLHEWSKVIKKGFLQDLNSGFWIQNSSC